MGVLKRIATARIWNPTLAGGRTDPEIAAMRRLAEAERQAGQRAWDADDAAGEAGGGF